MIRSSFLAVLVACLALALLPAARLSARPAGQEDAAIQGTLVFDKRYVTVRPLVPGQVLRLLMRFDPQDQQELNRRSGYFVLDDSRLRAVLAGGSLLDNNLAAGSPAHNGPINELVAEITQASGEYTVVIYNDTQIPLNFRLAVMNGAFPLEARQPQEAPAAPASAPPQAVSPSAPASAPPQVVSPSAPAAPRPAAPSPAATRRDPGADSVHTVAAGETLGLIAQSVYGDISLYAQLCRYNGIANCNVISVGQQLRTPPLALLTGSGDAIASAPPAPAANRSAVASPESASPEGSYTVVSGDTLGTIAQKLYGDFQRFREICTLNGLGDCNALRVGQVLRLPDGAAATAAPAAAPAVAALPAPQPSGMGIVRSLEQSGETSVFVMLWKTTGLLSLLETDGPFTLFVPADRVFAPVMQERLAGWMENKQVLEGLLSYHVLLQSFDGAGVDAPVELRTLEGRSLRVERGNDGGLLVNGARATGAPVAATNGIIYTIDQVLAPPQE